MLDNSTFDYKPHLKSAYIDPIRTVTVIDDEYPTIDDLISPTKDSFSQDNISRLKDIAAAVAAAMLQAAISDIKAGG